MKEAMQVNHNLQHVNSKPNLASSVNFLDFCGKQNHPTQLINSSIDIDMRHQKVLLAEMNGLVPTSATVPKQFITASNSVAASSLIDTNSTDYNNNYHNNNNNNHSSTNSASTNSTNNNLLLLLNPTITTTSSFSNHNAPQPSFNNGMMNGNGTIEPENQRGRPRKDRERKLSRSYITIKDDLLRKDTNRVVEVACQVCGMLD